MVAVAVLTVIGLAFTLNYKVKDSAAYIYLNGEVIRKIKLHEDDNYTFEIKTEYGSNTIVVKDGKIGVLDADCPDKICVHTPYISDGIQPIVCMPHKLIIQIEPERTD